MTNPLSGKIKLVVSDIHMGTGKFNPDGSFNFMEDFLDDDKFVEFIDYYTTEKYQFCEVELILNGDILNLIAIDYKGTFPYILTESISLEKVKYVLNGHPKVWDCLKNYLKNNNHKITYIIGNHDIEVVWNSVQDLINQRVGGVINFRTISYFIDGIWIEHGNQYEYVNRTEPKRMFITKGVPEPILHLPWGSVFVINCINTLKKIKPSIDKIKPYRTFMVWNLFFDTFFFFKLLNIMLMYLFIPKWGRKRYQYPTVNTSLKILGQLFSTSGFEKAAAKLCQSHKEIHTVIMGHTHVYRYKRVNKEDEYFNTGTWTEVTSLNLGNFGKMSKLTYVLIEYPSSQPNIRPKCQLLDWHGHITPYSGISL